MKKLKAKDVWKALNALEESALSNFQPSNKCIEAFCKMLPYEVKLELMKEKPSFFKKVKK